MTKIKLKLTEAEIKVFFAVIKHCHELAKEPLDSKVPKADALVSCLIIHTNNLLLLRYISRVFLMVRSSYTIPLNRNEAAAWMLIYLSQDWSGCDDYFKTTIKDIAGKIDQQL